MPLAFAGAALRLSAADLAAAATAAGFDPALVAAVKAVEAGPRGGFLPDGRPVILFEARHFDDLTGGVYRDAYPSISSATWDRALYAATAEGEYDRLMLAATLDRDAALRSASWGLFQIMGSNHAICGYATAEAFVAACGQSEAVHLAMFLAFVNGTHLAAALRAHDWSSFALHYNGPGNIGAYAARLVAAYDHACTLDFGSPEPAPAPPAPPVPPPPVPDRTTTNQYEAVCPLNVRVGPGPNFLRTRRSPLPAGGQVTVTETKDGWGHVAFDDGETGWAYMHYLRQA